jgi:hypothetical protein
MDPAIDKEIETWLTYYGVTKPFDIEVEAKIEILNALRQDDVTRVYIDTEGGLMIEFREDNE